MTAGRGAVSGDAAFDRLALKVHAAQRASNPLLRRYWDALSDRQPTTWHEIPPVPVRAFRDVPIVTGTPEVVFRTSGTTGDGAPRGEHHVASLELYRSAARSNYRRHLFAGADTLTIISLVPNPAAVPDSSLATMAGFIAREPEVTHTAWAFDPERGVDLDAVREAVAAAPPPPILLLTTAFALVQLLDALAESPLPFPTARASWRPAASRAARPKSTAPPSTGACTAHSASPSRTS